MTKYVVPMEESERGWGSKIDGYAGPFEDLVSAKSFVTAYNLKNNNEKSTPDYYIMALQPVTYTSQRCDYLTTVDGVEYNESKNVTEPLFEKTEKTQADIANDLRAAAKTYNALRVEAGKRNMLITASFSDGKIMITSISETKTINY